jgi:hypothetical protein
LKWSLKPHYIQSQQELNAHSAERKAVEYGSDAQGVKTEPKNEDDDVKMEDIL